MQIAVKTLALSFAALLASCSQADECTPSEAFCDSPMTFRKCVFDNAKPDRNIWSTTTCASGYACVEASDRNEGNTDGVVNPSCVMNGERNPACASSGSHFACIGDRELKCNNGFVDSHNTCVNCEIANDEFRFPICDASSNGDGCENSDECAPGLECQLVGTSKECTTTCGCAGFESCDDCTVYGVPNYCLDSSVCHFGA